MEQTQTNHPPEPEFKTTCGGSMQDPNGFSSAVYHGEKVYFCSHACLSAFEQAPDLFMAGEIEHPMND